MYSSSSDSHTSKQEALIKKRVWDLPTRLFHWALAATVCIGWYLGEYRDFSTINLHFYFGYATLGLIILRLLWALSKHLKKDNRTLYPNLKNLLAYSSTLLKRKPSGIDGHNPIGAISALIILTALGAQVITGLFAEDDTMFSSGPLANWIDETTVVTMTAFHYWISRLLLGLIGLHIFAVLFYLFWKRENLIRPMISGWKLVKKTKE